MKNILPENILLQLSEFIAFNLALYFPKERWNDLERKIVSAAKEFGYQDVGRFIHHIMSSPLTREHSDILASYLTINETYFWREPQSFEALEQKILPELIHLRKKKEKRIRIWSAGCSTGEEPYSIAIALRRLIPDIDNWNITILATDINPEILQKAITGVYSQWSFRNAPKWLKEKYFLPAEKGKFEILSEIKGMVRFEYLNLAKDIFPSPLNNTNAMDIIFCRNVLMYFTNEHFGQTVNGLFNSLVEGGYLMVGACELSTQNFPQFESVGFPGVVIYRKRLRDSYNTSGVGFEIKPETAVVMEESPTCLKYVKK
jgi:chemotaxis protein methyltransferase CheR